MGYALVRSTDGGRIWQAQSDPCSRTGPGLGTVDFASPSLGFVMCESEPATDMQTKVLLATTNAGSTWSKRAASCPGAVSCVGYLPKMSFLPDGRGWLWLDRYGMAATTTGGRSWGQIAGKVVSDDINDVLSASLVSDTIGFVLIDHSEDCPVNACGPELLYTTNAGETWTALAHWKT